MGKHIKHGFPGGAVVKNMLANAGDGKDMDSIPGSGRSPGVEKWQPAPIFSPGKYHGRGSLVGYSSWGLKESHNWATEHKAHIHIKYSVNDYEIWLFSVIKRIFMLTW